MQFDIVFITRNRQSILPISVPLMLSQNRLPYRFIVVDSSDKHKEVVKILEKIVCDMNVNIDLQIVKSHVGMALQRNIGLKYVQSPVVMFPDDDALWFDNHSDSILKIYEKDCDNLIGAVCATETTKPPSGVIKVSIHRMEVRDRLQLLTSNFIRPIENRLFPDPIFTYNYSATNKTKPPVWLSQEEAVLSGPMTGFRMTFRTNVIKRLKFDESLGKYSLFEDRDASLAVLQNYLIVRSVKAKAFHYRVPEKRVDGIEWGTLQILNRAYVTCKHNLPGSLERHRLKRYSYYKLARYIMQAQTHYGCQRVIGAWRALKRTSTLLNTPRKELTDRYIKLRDECLGQDKSI